MKKVLKNHQEVAHVWASQSQAEGRSGNMFFNGPSIFSYGEHFEIARIVAPKVVLFNEARYSSSTGKHQSYTWRAVSHMKVYTVPSMFDHNTNVDYLTKGILSAVETIKKSRTGMSNYYAHVLADQKTAAEYVAQFKKDITPGRRRALLVLTKKVFFTDAERKVWKLKEAKHAEVMERTRITRKRNDEIRWANRGRILDENKAHVTALVEVAERVWLDEITEMTRAAWVAGESQARIPYDSPVMLRIVAGEIETSQGAIVPIEGAKELWAKLSAGEQIEGFQIGHYTVSGIHDKKLVIGCHRIPLREVARMSRALNLAGSMQLEVI